MATYLSNWKSSFRLVLKHEKTYCRSVLPPCAFLHLLISLQVSSFFAKSRLNSKYTYIKGGPLADQMSSLYSNMNTVLSGSV